MGNDDSVEIFDSELAKHGVHFLPWIGDRYERAPFGGRKLLVLGESHYREWNGESHECDSHFTRTSVQECIERDQERAPLWFNIENVLLGDTSDEAARKLWPGLAFYNFVQSSVRDANEKPAKRQFEESRSPFLKLIEVIRPDRVLVCGRSRLWPGMPSTPYESQGDTSCFLRKDLQAYRLGDGTQVWCLAMTHPSRAFSWRKWHPVVAAFLRDPQQAAHLL